MCKQRKILSYWLVLEQTNGRYQSEETFESGILRYNINLNELQLLPQDATIHQTVWNTFSEEIHQWNRSTNIQQVEETKTENPQEMVTTSTMKAC